MQKNTDVSSNVEDFGLLQIFKQIQMHSERDL